MPGKQPFQRLSDCASELEDEGFVISSERQNDVLFYIRPEKTAEHPEARDLDKTMLRDHARGIAVEDYNLTFFDHNDNWVVSTLPQEENEDFLF